MKHLNKEIDRNDTDAILKQKDKAIKYLKLVVKHLKIECCCSGKEGSTMEETVMTVYE